MKQYSHESVNNNGHKGLHWAALHGHTEEVKLLLKKGADVNATNQYDYTALHYAARNGLTDVVKLLLEHKAEVNAKDKYGATALHWAANNGRTDVVKLLLKSGANIEAKNIRGEIPLQVATTQELKTILKNTEKLFRAAKSGDMAEARRLLESGAEVNAKNNYGYTVLHEAAYNGYADVVKVLFENGSEITFKDIYHAKNTKCYLIGRKCRFNYILPPFFLMSIASSITGIVISQESIEDQMHDYISYILLSLIGIGFISGIMMPAFSIAQRDWFRSIKPSAAYNASLSNSP